MQGSAWRGLCRPFVWSSKTSSVLVPYGSTLPNLPRPGEGDQTKEQLISGPRVTQPCSQAVEQPVAGPVGGLIAGLSNSSAKHAAGASTSGSSLSSRTNTYIYLCQTRTCMYVAHLVPFWAVGYHF